jgi:hypothetical protein
LGLVLRGDASLFSAIVIAMVFIIAISTIYYYLAGLNAYQSRLFSSLSSIASGLDANVWFVPGGSTINVYSDRSLGVLGVIVYTSSGVSYLNTSTGGGAITYISPSNPLDISTILPSNVISSILGGEAYLGVLMSNGILYTYRYINSGTNSTNSTPDYASWDPLQLRAYLLNLLSQGRLEELVSILGSIDYTADPIGTNYRVLGVSFRTYITGDYGSLTQILVVRNISSATIHMAESYRCFTAQNPDGSHVPWKGSQVCGGSSIIVVSATARDVIVSADAWEPPLTINGYWAVYDTKRIQPLASGGWDGWGRMPSIGSIDPSRWLVGGSGGNATTLVCSASYVTCYSGGGEVGGWAGGVTSIVASFTDHMDLLRKVLRYAIDLWILRAVGGYEDFPFAPWRPEWFSTATVFRLTPSVSGTWGFAIDSDDASDVVIVPASSVSDPNDIYGTEGGRVVVTSWYGYHPTSRSSSFQGFINLSAGTDYYVVVRQVQGGGGRAVGLYIRPPGTSQWIPMDRFGIYSLSSYASTSQIYMRAWVSSTVPRNTAEMDGLFNSYRTQAPFWSGNLRSIWLAGGGVGLQLRFNPAPPPFPEPIGGPSGGLGGLSRGGVISPPMLAAIGGSGGGGGGLALIFTSYVSGFLTATARGGLGGAGSTSVEAPGVIGALTYVKVAWTPGSEGAGGIAIVIYENSLGARITADASGSPDGVSIIYKLPTSQLSIP